MMKLSTWMFGISAAGLMVLQSGCTKQEEAPPAPPATPAAPAASSSTTVVPAVPAAVISTVTQAVAGMAQAAQQASNTAAQQLKAAADQAAQAAQAATQQSNTAFQGLLDQAKKLTVEKKYQEALSILNQFASAKLTPEQQKMVADLKVQIQQAMVGAALAPSVPALTNVLGGNR